MHRNRTAAPGYVEDNRGHDTPCWIWQGSTTPKGYGSTWSPFHKRMVGAHRHYYETHVGPIPNGLQIDHLCRVPACVNPAHLEPVTPAENTRRGKLAAPPRTVCRKGLHDFTDPANVFVNSTGDRCCRACRRESWRRHYHANKRQGTTPCATPATSTPSAPSPCR